MKFRNTFQLFLNNFKNVYVLLLFRLVIFIVTGSLAGLILASGIRLAVDSAEMANLVKAGEGILSAILTSGSYDAFDISFRLALDNVVLAFGNLLTFLGTHVTEIVFGIIGLVALYLVDRFLNGLAMFAFGDILNDKMSQYAKTPFFAGFFRNFGGAALYQVVYVPVSFAYDVLTLALTYLVFFRALAFVPVIILIFLAVTFLVVTQAIKFTLVSDWMPAIIADGKKLRTAMKESFTMGGKRFFDYFSGYLMAIFCIIAINALFAVTTFFSALLITIPASYGFILCMQFVNYYTTHEKKYFIDFTTIYEPESEGITNFR